MRYLQKRVTHSRRICKQIISPRSLSAKALIELWTLFKLRGRLQVKILLNTFLQTQCISNWHHQCSLDYELFWANLITTNILNDIINDDTRPLYDNFVLYGWLCYFFLWFDPFPIHQTLLSNWDTSASKSHLQYQCILWRIDINKHFCCCKDSSHKDC